MGLGAPKLNVQHIMHTYVKGFRGDGYGDGNNGFINYMSLTIGAR